jgi:energy-coupling factor transporter ATP-binding protein EcfA2
LAFELAFHSYSFQYWKDTSQALADINLTVRPGSVCAILGPTNAGKTTLLQSISGILGNHHAHSIVHGSIRIGKQSYDPLPRSVLFPGVGLTTQEPYFQISGLRETVAEEVALTLESLGADRSQVLARTDEILQRLGLSSLADRKPFTLSGGELQRVALATILVAKPPVLLMDEPCNSLDGLAQERLTSIIRSLKNSTTILIADYRIDFALETADEFVVMNKGRILFSGGKKKFVQRLATFGDVLPVTQWIRALKAVQKSPIRKRILRTVGLQ